MFTQDFANYSTPEDSIMCLVDGFECYATLHHDPDTQPDQDTMPLAAFSAWCNDEWRYVGVVVTVWKCGVQLIGGYKHAIWGIDCNFPDGSKERGTTNWYLRDCANDLIDDALESAKEKLQELCK